MQSGHDLRVDFENRDGAGGFDEVSGQILLEAGQINDLMELPDLLALGSLPELSNPIEPVRDVLFTVQDVSSLFLDGSTGLQYLIGD